MGASVGRLTAEERKAVRASPSQAIDVTNAERRAKSTLGHSYYHQNPWVSSDVALFLAVGATPEERGLVRDEETAFWSFPDDYEDNILETARRLIAKYGRERTDP